MTVPFSLLLKPRSHTLIRGAQEPSSPPPPPFFPFSVRWASSRIIYKTKRKVPLFMTSLLCFFFSLHCLTASLFGPFSHNFDCSKQQYALGGWWGGGVLGLIFTGYVQLASQNSYPIIVYSVANLVTFYFC